MHTFWSDFIQSPLELYESRALRFREDNRADWLPAMGAADGMRVLEIGCAGGLLLHRLKQALPHIDAVGLDRDDNHIAFAKAKSEELGIPCTFVVGDALALPFPADSFDLCYSHTVIEHVPAGPFLAEQYRVLRPGGRIAVLSVRTQLNLSPESWKPVEGEEKALLDKLWAGVDMSLDKQHGVAQYGLSESEIPGALEAAGFAQVDVAMRCLLAYAPDNAGTPPELAQRQINENRIGTLESMRKALRRNPHGLTDAEVERLTALIHARYDRRLAQYRQGEKQWDMATSTVLVATGVKQGKERAARDKQTA